MGLVRRRMEQFLGRKQPRGQSLGMVAPQEDLQHVAVRLQAVRPKSSPISRRAACSCSSMNGSVTFDAATSANFARARAFDCSNAFIAAIGSQGCCSASVRRMPRMCMIGNIRDLRNHAPPPRPDRVQPPTSGWPLLKQDGARGPITASISPLASMPEIVAPSARRRRAHRTADSPRSSRSGRPARSRREPRSRPTA